MHRAFVLGPLVVAALACLPTAVLAQGGPPLITDDPDTPGPGYWEINIAGIIERTRSARLREAPLADINYGVGERIQLKFEIPWLNVHELGKPDQTHLGPSNTGVKWRFLGQEGRTVAWSIYPQLLLPSHHSTPDSGDDDVREFFFPTELTLEIGRFEINGEIGRNFVQHRNDSWMYGFTTEASLYSGLELLGELHGEKNGPLPTEMVINIGARQKITRQVRLLAAVGTGIRGSPDDRLNLRLYFGLQFNLPGQYVFDQSASLIPFRGKRKSEDGSVNSR